MEHAFEHAIEVASRTKADYSGIVNADTVGVQALPGDGSRIAAWVCVSTSLNWISSTVAHLGVMVNGTFQPLATISLGAPYAFVPIERVGPDLCGPLLVMCPTADTPMRVGSISFVR